MIHVLVVDDHPVVSQGLVAVLGDFDDLSVTAAAEDAVAAVERLRPDVVLLDLELGEVSGLDLLPRLRELSSVVVFTAYGGDDRIFAALDAGARGYLLKGAPVADIVSAIRAVHAGGTWLEPSIAGRVVARTRGGALTARQSEILRLVAQGMSSKEIASSLGLSERTVKFHVNGIFNKLGAENRAQAVALAAQRGLI